MYNNDYMYAIERNEDYLAHYGIRGMKWGVRKAIASGNSARLGRQYAKAQKKLAKLGKQAGKSKKYARRAALMGAGAAAAGGLAAAGTEGVRKGLNVGGKLINRAGHGMSSLGEMTRGSRNKALRKVGMALDSAGRSVATAGNIVGGNKVGNAISNWGNSRSITRSVDKGLNRFGSKLQTKYAGNAVAKKAGLASWKGSQAVNKANLSNNAIARIGAGVVGAGLAAGAARNAYKAATAKKKAERFRTEMNKAFAGTQYAKGGNQQSSKPRQGKKRRK